MKVKAFIYIILAGVLWGTSGIFSHYLSPYGFTALHITAMRGLVSLLGVLIYALLRDRTLFKVKPKELLIFIGIGVSLFFTSSCYFTAMRMTSVSTAVVLMYSAPIYVTVFSVLFLKERLSALKIVSIIGMLIGCCLVSGIVGGLSLNFVGILIGIASGLAYASYNITTKISMQMGARPVSALIYSFGTMTLIALCVSQPYQIITNTAKAPLIIIPMLLALGVITFILPYLFYTLAMRDIPAGTGSALSIVEPMAATFFSVVMFGEKLDAFSTLGILLILAAVVLLGRAESGKQNSKS